MQVVLCNDKTYEKKYQQNAYKFLQLKDLNQLVGRKAIQVLIHEDDMYEEDHYYNLQSQVEALGFFGFCKVQYWDEDGFLEYQKPLTGNDTACTAVQGTLL